MLKNCTDCKQALPVSSFNKNGSTADGLQHTCRECQKGRAKRYREINSKVLSAKSSDWAKANREKVNQYRKKAYAKNPEKVKMQVAAWAKLNKNSVNEKTKRWASANPSTRAARQARRVAAKMNRTPLWLTRDDFRKMSNFYKAAQVLTQELGVVHHVDHIYPLQGDFVSGLHVPSNLQVITAFENVSKSNTYLPE